MKKRIFIFLTLLIACFSLFSVISNNKVTYAAGDEASLEYDANAAISSVPSKAIISFPVTSESVYGNTITWSVTCDDGSITYDDDADWMVVHRDENNAGTATLTVTVSNGESTVTKDREVTVPAGYTAAPKYTVNFVDNDNDDTNNLEPLTYKLGDATINLNEIRPAANGTKVFKGWYTTPNFEKGTEISKILVGSMKNYTLYALWEDLTVTELEITAQPTNKTYTAQQSFDKTGLVVMAHYNDGNSEDVTLLAEYSKTVLHVGDESVVVTFGGESATITGIVVNPITFDVSGITFESASKAYNGKAQTIEYVGELPEGLSAEVQGSATNVSEGAVNISLVFSVTSEGYDNYPSDYTVPDTQTVQLTITKATNNVVSEPVLEGWTYGSVANTPSASATFGEIKYTYSTTVDGEYTEIVPTNAGTYYVKASVADNENYNGAKATKEFVIGKKLLSLTTTPQTIKISEAESLTWEFTPTGLVDGDNLASIIGNTITAKYYIDGVETALMAGKTYEVRFTGTTYENYEITINNSSLSISKEDLYFAYENFENVVYDGSNKMFSVKAYAENGVTDILIDDAEISIKLDDSNFTGATEAGIYTVVISIDSPSYGTLSETKLFEIEKATIDLSHVTLTGGTVKYTGSNQAIKVVGLDDARVKVVYNITEAIDVNTYNFTATFSSNDNNYKVNVESLNATLVIEKASNAISGLTIAGWTYGEYDLEENKPSASATFGKVVYTYSNALEGDYTSEVPTNAGTYYVKASVVGNDNYESAEDIESFEIGKATIDLSMVTLTGGTVQYNGLNQAIKVVGLDNEKVNVVYNITEAIDVNTYNFTATFSSNDNNYKVNVESLNATLVIEKASNAISGLTIAGWTYGEYDAEENKPSASATFGTVVYTYSNALEGDYTSEVPTNAGTYYVKASVEGNDNYEGAVDTKSFEIAQKVLTQGNVQITVLGSDYNTSVSSTLKPGVTVMYGKKEITTYDELVYTYADESKVGQATITITFNGNYSGEVYAYFDVTEFGRAGVDAAGLPSSLDEATLADGVDMTVGSSNVFWSSSSTAVVFDAEGNVTINKAALTEDTTVTITAIVTYGETSAYKKTYEVEISAITVIPSQTDENTGIIAENANGELNVEVKENGNFTINEYNNTVKVYDISFEGEIHNEITIKIPVPEGYENSELSVYHIVDGNPVFMDAKKEDGYLVFTSNSFSPYVVTVKLYEIKFVNGTTTVKTSKVESGKLPVAPETNPTKASTAEYSYEFAGWDLNGDGKVDALAAATKDAEYKAVFTETLRSYTVTFDSNGGTEVAAQTIEYGKTVSLPTEPTKENYTFVGWNLNDSPFDFSAQITGDIILVAEWEEKEDVNPETPVGESIIIEFISNDGGDSSSGLPEVTKNHVITESVSNFEQYIDSIIANEKVYVGKSGTGLKFGSKSAKGDITVTLKEGYYVSGIKLVTSAYGSDSYEVVIDGATLLDGQYVFTNVTNSFEITSKNTSQSRFYLHSIELVLIESDNPVNPGPTHEHIECPECGLCIDPNCDGIIAEQCQGHNTTPENPSEGQWVLVTDASTLKSGDKIVIVAKDSNVALSITQNSNNRGQTSIEKSNDKSTITFGDDVQKLTLEVGKTAGTFAFKTDNGYLYAASSSSNHLKEQDTLNDNGSWEITISDDGNATIKAQGTNSRNWLRYNSTSSIFSCYASGQQDICIYICK